MDPLITLYVSWIKWLEANMLTCPSVKYFSIECPGCGMQRSMIALLKGNFSGSLVMYPASPEIQIFQRLKNHYRIANGCCKYHYSTLHLQNCYAPNFSLNEPTGQFHIRSAITTFTAQCFSSTGARYYIHCCCYGVPGVVCSIVALILYGKDAQLYQANPEWYTASSYSNLRTGRICAIVGLIPSIVFLLFWIFVMITAGFGILRNPQDIFNRI